jgi:hypothetical protein
MMSLIAFVALAALLPSQSRAQPFGGPAGWVSGDFPSCAVFKLPSSSEMRLI